jgi:simple sugar transport system substrate-binding protein
VKLPVSGTNNRNLRGIQLMKKRRYFLAPLAALAMVATACGGDDDAGSTTAPADSASETTGGATTAGETTPESTNAVETTVGTTDTVEQTEGSDITIAVITHGDGGVFWSVFQKGAEQAGADLGIKVKYQGSNNTGTEQAALIDQAVSDGVDGLAVSLADPDAVKASVLAAGEAGIPIVTTNSGSDLFTEFGAFTHIGQDEVVAGNGAGRKFNEAGATKVLCAKQEQSNVGLEARCQGLEETFEGEVIQITTSGDADPVTQQAEIKAELEKDPSIDGVFGTGPVIAHHAVLAAEELGVTPTIAGVDLSPDLLADISAGKAAFTIDQQQYVQGYLSVVLLYLNVTNENTTGGGLPVYTGPGFVDASNVEAVQKLVDAGTR